MTTVAPGVVLAGKYRVDRVLGQGGMGVVVAATHLQLDKKVALKFLLPQVLQNAELVARFAREAQAAGKIQSEHVAKVLDVGALENGAPYMVMEYLEGSDLAHLVKSRGALPGQDVVEYVLQACEALAEAHVAGIVHRDLKPANLFLVHRADGSPSIKVLDFGISKVTVESDHGQGMTQTSAVMGSPSYMAPEQLKSSRNVDARTDVWALGIILHELLTGEVAFKADTVPELYVSILQSPAPQLRQRRADAPAGMEAIVTRCLEKDPARRFANVGELAQALGEFAPPRARPSVERIMRIVGARASQLPPSSSPSQMPPAQQQQYATPQGTSSISSGGQGSIVVGQHGGPTPAGPAQSYPSAGYGQPAAAGYGQQYPQAQQPMGYQTPPQQYGPPPQPPAQPQQQSMSSATIALIIIVAAVVIFGGSCAFCVCVSAASDNRQHRRSEQILLEDGRNAWGAAAPGDRSEASVQAEALPLPFQPQAGWTRLSASARTRPPSQPAKRSQRLDDLERRAAWDASGSTVCVLVEARPRRRASSRRDDPERSGATSGAKRSGRLPRRDA